MYEILEKKILWSGKFLRCVSVTYRDSSGSIRDWEVFERVNCDGIVAIVPVTAGREALIIRQFRPAVGRYVIEFPAGLNDKGETLEAAARRELLEETGYSAGELIFLAEGPVSSGSSDETLTVYLAKGLEFKGNGQRDETEDIEVLNIPITEFYDRVNALSTQGNAIDLKIFGLMELAKKHL
ncbi:MAG: NUDIX hydrolase [Nitrospirae bacterium]|nr:MAG: NUDIX hydrolase [Nitrospirota bacterium]